MPQVDVLTCHTPLTPETRHMINATTLGLMKRGAIYVNYVFLSMWFADVCWWWLAPASHASRPLRVETLRLVLFTFMFMNGAIVFASGTGRLVGIASLAAVLLASPAARHPAARIPV